MEDSMAFVWGMESERERCDEYYMIKSADTEVGTHDVTVHWYMMYRTSSYHSHYSVGVVEVPLKCPMA